MYKCASGVRAFFARAPVFAESGFHHRPRVFLALWGGGPLSSTPVCDEMVRFCVSRVVFVLLSCAERQRVLPARASHSLADVLCSKRVGNQYAKRWEQCLCFYLSAGFVGQP